MKALADYIHAKGLKLGVYSSPGPKTCAGFEGSFGHEEQDAKTYGKWGVDYLKYDWCSCQSKDKRAPYALMGAALDKSSRDIIFSLCQYGEDDVWTWGSKVNGNSWRTTGDIQDTWSSVANIGFAQSGHEKFAGPGHWNDPDMLVVGRRRLGESASIPADTDGASHSHHAVVAVVGAAADRVRSVAVGSVHHCAPDER